MMSRGLGVLLGALACIAGIEAKAADLQVSEPWARETLPGQKVGAVYLKLKSEQAARLVAVQSPSAERAEIHEMRHEGDVMKMRRLPSLALPAGQEIALKPAGVHIMLMELREPLRPGGEVRLSLEVEEGDKRSRIPVRAPVKPLVENGKVH